jgi:hypothetical protein
MPWTSGNKRQGPPGQERLYHYAISETGVAFLCLTGYTITGIRRVRADSPQRGMSSLKSSTAR